MPQPLLLSLAVAAAALLLSSSSATILRRRPTVGEFLEQLERPMLAMAGGEDVPKSGRVQSGKGVVVRAHLDYVTQPCDISHMTI